MLHILVATQELVHCLICPHLPSGAARPQAHAYISGSALVPVLQLLLVNLLLLIWSHTPSASGSYGRQQSDKIPVGLKIKILYRSHCLNFHGVYRRHSAIIAFSWYSQVTLLCNGLMEERKIWSFSATYVTSVNILFRQ